MTRRDTRKAERFLQHLEPMKPQLSGYCRRALLRAGDAPDVLHSAITTAFSHFDRFCDGTNFRAWIFRYVTFEVLNANRAAVRNPAPLQEEPACERLPLPAYLEDVKSLVLHEDHQWKELFDDAVNDAVAQLNENERHVLLLRTIGGFKYREISELLDVPMGTVTGLLARARTRMRSKLIADARERECHSSGKTA